MGHTNHILNTKRTRCVNATAGGITAINGTVLDMLGFDGVVFTCCLGTLSGTQVTSLKAQGGTKSDGSDMADLVGAVTANAADADGNKMLVLDVFRMDPTLRYIRPVVNRATANAVVDSVVAEQYGGGTTKKPESEDATTTSAAALAVEPRLSQTYLTQTTTTYTGTTTTVSSTARSSS